MPVPRRGGRRRRWGIAIDTHLVPYYGERTPHVVGGLRKAGTKSFHGYATAMLPHRGRRYTLAIEALHRPHQVVGRLLDRVAGFGLKVGGVTADSLAHLIRQVWVLLAEQLGRATGRRDPGWVSDLPSVTLPARFHPRCRRLR